MNTTTARLAAIAALFASALAAAASPDWERSELVWSASERAYVVSETLPADLYQEAMVYSDHYGGSVPLGMALRAICDSHERQAASEVRALIRASASAPR